MLHVGHKYETKHYLPEEGQVKELQTVTIEKQLGVCVLSSQQCTKAALKAMSSLRLIKRNFKELQINEFKHPLSNGRPQMEYCVGPTRLVANSQVGHLLSAAGPKKGYKLISGLQKLTYEQRLD